VSRATKWDMRAGDLVARFLNEIRFRLGLRSGKHRSLGLSTYQWVRVAQTDRTAR
jgi:hypothetical protein